MKVLYHSNCPDGFTSAWIIKKFIDPKADCIPCKYGDPPPDLGDDELVLIVDFSYPRPILEAMSTKHKVTVIDHHKTAQAELENLECCKCVFDMSKSGAMLTWEYFRPFCKPPQLVEYVQDRDLWRFQLDYSREVAAYIRSVPHDFAEWTDLYYVLEDSFPIVVMRGAGILQFINAQSKIQADNARTERIGKYVVPCVNTGGQGSDTLHELLARNPESGFVVGYFDRADGKRQFELRGNGTFDVSEVAKEFGGGGHKNAAGFVSEDRRSVL